jgi:lysozyme
MQIVTTASLVLVDKAIPLLTKHEGYRTKLYKDTRGIETIGVGFNLREGLRPEEIDFILRNRIDLLDQGLQKYEPYKKLDIVRKLVLLDMAYNLGVRGLRAFVKMWAALELKDYKLAAAEILDSDAARELPTRYKELASMMRTGEYNAE